MSVCTLTDFHSRNQNFTCREIVLTNYRFLLPALQIQTVLDQTTISKRRKALHTMPTELKTAFASTIGRINSQKQERAIQAMEVLKWMFLAQRQLTIAELRHALSVEIDSNDDTVTEETLDWDNLPSEKSLIDWCLGLVIIDDETSTVRLVHKSLHDYLKKRHEEGDIFPHGHGEIAYTCVKYMNFADENGLEYSAEGKNHTICGERVNLRKIFERRLEKFSLLHYAVINWGHHARIHTTPGVLTLGMRLFILDGPHLNRVSPYLDLYWHNLSLLPAACLPVASDANSAGPELYPLFALNCAAGFGLKELLQAVIEKWSCNINFRGTYFMFKGLTPLMLACKKGHEACVRLLLD